MVGEKYVFYVIILMLYDPGRHSTENFLVLIEIFVNDNEWQSHLYA